MKLAQMYVKTLDAQITIQGLRDDNEICTLYIRTKRHSSMEKKKNDLIIDTKSQAQTPVASTAVAYHTSSTSKFTRLLTCPPIVLNELLSTSPNQIPSLNHTNSANPVLIPVNHKVFTHRTSKRNRGVQIRKNDFGSVVLGLAVFAGAVGTGVVVFVAVTGLLEVVGGSVDGGHG